MKPKLVYGLGLSFLVSGLCVIVLVVSYIKNKRPLVISNAYIVNGTINIPYAGIVEPFNAWYDGDNNLSRIDYYNGTVKTYFLGNNYLYGISLEIVPVTTETYTNVPTCFGHNGTHSQPITPQDILPDFSNFDYVGIEILKGHQCEKWRNIVKSFERTSEYTIWLRWEKSSGTPLASHTIPVRYEMIGYDTLLGSHYDHYYLDYDDFILKTPDNKVFQPPEYIPCSEKTNLSDPHVYNFNPMKELIDRHTDQVDDAWEKYKTVHSKSYDDKEHEERKDVFKNNLRFIHSTNRQGLGYTVKVNHFADRNDKEYSRYKGRLFKQGYNGGSEFPYSSAQVEQLEATLPREFDWRTRGAVTAVKDQAICGSCWGFGTTGTIEGAYYLKTGRLINFSEQALVDCSWGQGNRGCNGGNSYYAFQWILKHGGIPSDKEYGHYLGEDGYCHIKNVTMMAKIQSYVNVTSGDEKALRVAIYKHGPIVVSIDASHNAFKFYSSGIYYKKTCQNKIGDLDHSALAIGYGSINGTDYWLIKNSWSKYWGDKGYVLMATHNCGVETAASYVVLA